MAKTLTEIAAEIVAAQAGSSSMTPDEIGDALRSTFSTLVQLRMAEGGEEASNLSSKAANFGVEAVPDEISELRTRPSRSIKKNKVICLECGAEFKQLTNGHLKEHGITTKEYRKKYGFTARQPLSAQSLSAKRRKSAQDRNLGEILLNARKKSRKSENKTAAKGAPRKKATVKKPTATKSTPKKRTAKKG